MCVDALSSNYPMAVKPGCLITSQGEKTSIDGHALSPPVAPAPPFCQSKKKERKTHKDAPSTTFHAALK
jgi:hypothetical protein